MKKLIAALFAVLLTTAGLVAVSSAPASAGCKASSYNCTKTDTKPSGPKKAKPGKTVKNKVQIKAKDAAGNIKPSGTLTVTVKGPGPDETYTFDVKNGKVTVPLKFTEPGTYKVHFDFKGDEGFKDSDSTKTITVKDKKKN